MKRDKSLGVIPRGPDVPPYSDIEGPSKAGQALEGKELALASPAEMQAYLLSHPLSAGGRLWCDRILAGVDRGERTALRLFGEAMKWTGGTAHVGQVLIQQIGVSIHDAKAYVAFMKRAEGMTDEERAAEYIAWLNERGYTVLDPDKRVNGEAK